MPARRPTSRQSLVAQAVQNWEQALASTVAGSAALGPSSRRAALVVDNFLALSEKTRRILNEAVESSRRLATETQASAVFVLRLDALAKFSHLLATLERIQDASGDHWHLPSEEGLAALAQREAASG